MTAPDLRPAQRFVRQLANHNDRDWFEAHRDGYERDVKGPALAWIEAVGPRLLDLDPELEVQPRVNGSLFRIHRDVRFSKDKRPYKTEVGFRFWPGDRADGRSALMLRVRPHAVGLGVGIWAFSKEAREQWRQRVAGPDGEALAPILDGLLAQGFHTHHDQLKRVPKPWGPEHLRGDWLRCKGLFLGIEEEIPPGPEMADWAVRRFQQLSPVHQFLRAVAG